MTTTCEACGQALPTTTPEPTPDERMQSRITAQLERLRTIMTGAMEDGVLTAAEQSNATMARSELETLCSRARRSGSPAQAQAADDAEAQLGELMQRWNAARAKTAEEG